MKPILLSFCPFYAGYTVCTCCGHKNYVQITYRLQRRCPIVFEKLCQAAGYRRRVVYPAATTIEYPTDNELLTPVIICTQRVANRLQARGYWLLCSIKNKTKQNNINFSLQISRTLLNGMYLMRRLAVGDGRVIGIVCCCSRFFFGKSVYPRTSRMIIIYGIFFFSLGTRL